MPYPIVEQWYLRQEHPDGITRFWEPHVHPLEQANFWHVRGRDRDLLIDSGMGIVPLRTSFPDLFEGRETIALATHTHIDHIGAVHEFEHRWVHPAEAHHMESPSGLTTIVASDIDPELCRLFVEAGYPPFDELLVDAFPYEGFDPRSYRLRGAPPTRLVTEEDVIDLGDRQFRLLHLPGHSPGSLGVWEEATGTLFTGDVVYDGPLVYEGPGMDLDIYAATLRELRDMPVSIIHAGHDPSFGPARLGEIVDRYLALWGRT